MKTSSRLLNPSAESRIITEYGEFVIRVYQDEQAREHVSLSQGSFHDGEAVLVRIQSECLTGEVFHSLLCDCGPQLIAALQKINEMGRGVLLYLRQEGRDIGLTNKIKAHELQRQGLDTVEANEKLGFPPDARTYTTAVALLKGLGIDHVKLMTNNPDKIKQLEVDGIVVVERIPLEIAPNGVDNRYLSVKKSKMGHLLKEI